jgi:hypothetical protein
MNATLTTRLFHAITEDIVLLEEVTEVLAAAQDQVEGGAALSHWLRERAEAWAASTPVSAFQYLFTALLLASLQQLDPVWLARRLQRFLAEEQALAAQIAEAEEAESNPAFDSGALLPEDLPGV